MTKARWKWLVAGLGALLALASAVLFVLPTGGGEKADAFDEGVIKDGRFVDRALGVTVVAPAGISLYDVEKMREKSRKMRERVGARLLFSGSKAQVAGWVNPTKLPPKVAAMNALGTLFGDRQPARDDDLVPLGLRGVEGLACEGWRLESRQAVVARAADGRMVTTVCEVKRAGAEGLCRAVFEGVTLAPVLAR